MVTRKDRIRNDNTISVAAIEEKMIENRLRWFGNVYRRLEYAVVTMDDSVQIPQKKRKIKEDLVRDD